MEMSGEPRKGLDEARQGGKSRTAVHLDEKCLTATRMRVDGGKDRVGWGEGGVEVRDGHETI